MSSNKAQKNTGSWMIAAERVKYIKWYPEDGVILREAREKRRPKKMSRRGLAKRLTEKGVECSHENIRNMESGETKSASLELLGAICQELGYELHEILPMIFMGSKSLDSSN